jgi:hypothetical protein
MKDCATTVTNKFNIWLCWWNHEVYISLRMDKNCEKKSKPNLFKDIGSNLPRGENIHLKTHSTECFKNKSYDFDSILFTQTLFRAVLRHQMYKVWDLGTKIKILSRYFP